MSIIAWLIVFFPVGLILMWSKSNWQQATKRIVTTVMTVMLIPIVVMMISSIIYSTTPAGIAAEKAQAVADAKQAKQEAATDEAPAPAQAPSASDSASPTEASASSGDASEIQPRQPLALPMTAADKKLAHAMPDPDAYPENGPEQTLALFLNGWKQKNWQQMALQTQPGWSNNPSDELSGDFDLRDLRGASLADINQVTSESADIPTTIYYLAAGPHPKVQKFSGVVHLMYDKGDEGDQPAKWTINPTQFQRAMSGYQD